MKLFFRLSLGLVKIVAESEAFPAHQTFTTKIKVDKKSTKVHVPPAVPLHLTSTDVSKVEKKSGIFQGLTFCILS